MIRCKGRYCLALVIIVFSWLFNLCKKYLYSEYIFILVVITVLLACVLCGSYPYTTQQQFFATGPCRPKHPTGIYIVPSPRYFQQVAHTSPGDDRVGSVATAALAETCS